MFPCVRFFRPGLPKSASFEDDEDGKKYDSVERFYQHHRFGVFLPLTLAMLRKLSFQQLTQRPLQLQVESVHTKSGGSSNKMAIRVSALKRIAHLIVIV